MKFLSYILRHNDEKGMSREEIIKTSGTLIVGGSETSATLLSGIIFHLLKNPSTLEKLTTEIRTTFSDTAEINFVKLAKLQYLNACIQEALRIYPPVPGIVPRKMIPGGAVINGYFIPEGVRLCLFSSNTRGVLIKVLGLVWCPSTECVSP
jgi:cytochrome P450